MNSLAPSTRKGYDYAVEGYRSHQRQHGLDAGFTRMTAVSVANYLAHLGNETDLCYNTIRTYRSALSTWRREGVLSDAPCPTHGEAVEAVMRGIRRDRSARDLQKRQEKAAAVTAITPAVLHVVSLHRGANGPKAIMMWAAANVALYAFLRPGELLGSYANASRSLRRSAIVWHHKPPPLAKGPSAPSSSASPQGNSSISHFTIDLGVTKADPTGSNPPVVVAARAAIDALKQWMDLQGDIGPSSILFRVAGEGALRMKELLDWCADCYAASGAPRPLFQGKGFRKGGASAALAQGAARPDIAAQGRWKTASMVEVYADAAAKAARVKLISQNLAGAP